MVADTQVYNGNQGSLPCSAVVGPVSKVDPNLWQGTASAVGFGNTTRKLKTQTDMHPSTKTQMLKQQACPTEKAAAAVTAPRTYAAVSSQVGALASLLS